MTLNAASTRGQLLIGGDLYLIIRNQGECLIEVVKAIEEGKMIVF